MHGHTRHFTIKDDKKGAFPRVFEHKKEQERGEGGIDLERKARRFGTFQRFLLLFMRVCARDSFGDDTIACFDCVG